MKKLAKVLVSDADETRVAKAMRSEMEHLAYRVRGTIEKTGVVFSDSWVHPNVVISSDGETVDLTLGGETQVSLSPAQAITLAEFLLTFASTVQRTTKLNKDLKERAEARAALKRFGRAGA